MKIVIHNPTDTANSGSIEFVYDATGAKLRKTVKYNNGSVKETWDYVNGVEYKNQMLQRIAHSEGAVVRNDFGQYQQEYVLRDHLGNVRVTFTDGVNKGLPEYGWGLSSAVIPDPGYDDGVVTEADIKHINHTYPFGMAMEGNWNNAGTANNNRYLYNGKQYNDDFGLGWYDYGARFYDPSIARWSAVDPLAEKYLRWSPYNYCADNPIKFTDPNGKNILISIKGEDGNPMSVEYRDGKLYKDDKEYTSGAGFNKDGKMTGFLQKSFDVLQQLSKTAKGKEMIMSLQEGNYLTGGHTTIISEGANNCKNRKVDKGSIAKITWTGEQAAVPVVQLGMTKGPSAIGLGHELAHSWDYQMGTFDAGLIAPKIHNAERFATFVENVIREQWKPSGAGTEDLEMREYYEVEIIGSSIQGKIQVFDNEKKKHIKSTDPKIIYYDYQFK